jgi:hypothetical protein
MIPGFIRGVHSSTRSRRRLTEEHCICCEQSLKSLIKLAQHADSRGRFAMHAIKQPLKTVLDASSVVNDLNVLDSSSAAFGDSVYFVVRYGRQLLDTLIPLERFYSLDAIKPILKREAEPQTYKGIPLTAMSTPSTEPLLQEGESKKIEIGGSTSESGQLAISSEREKDIGETEAHGMEIGKSIIHHVRAVCFNRRLFCRIRESQFHLSA